MDKYVSADNLEYYNEKIQQVIEDGDAVGAQVTVQLGTGGTLGGYKTGDTITANTPVKTVIKKLLAKQVPPTYRAPSVTINNTTGTNPGSYEIGTNITPIIKVDFVQNDAGAVTHVSLTKDNSQIAESTKAPMFYTDTIFTLTNQVVYKGTVSYEEGPIKNDNLGDPYPTNHILAGSTSSGNYVYNPYRQGYFWGILNTSSAEAPLTSAIIRSGTARNGAYATGTISGIAAAAVPNRKRIFIACPATNTGLTKVIMPSAMNADCTADFVKQNDTVLVEGANGYEGIAYNVWVYEPAAISDDQTFTVTLG